jgi:hypothetical protein
MDLICNISTAHALLCGYLLSRKCNKCWFYFLNNSALKGFVNIVIPFIYSSKNPLPFTPFSITVGNMVRELHQALCLALTMENSIPVITQLLKSLAALVQNTPYHRLEPGLITKIVRNVRPRLRHKGNPNTYFTLVKIVFLCLTKHHCMKTCGYSSTHS